VLNRAGVTALRNTGGSNARFCTTKFAPGGDKQGSIEYTFWPYSVTKTTSSDLQLKYWTVIFDMRSSGPGFENYGQNEMWKNAYMYAPMFLKKNTPHNNQTIAISSARPMSLTTPFSSNKLSSWNERNCP
jgi:hypothetical protein